MTWDVSFHDCFIAEYQELPEAGQDELQALVTEYGGLPSHSISIASPSFYVVVTSPAAVKAVFISA